MQKMIEVLSREARKNLRYDVPLEPDSEKMVDLNEARGKFSEAKFLYDLGVSGEEEALEPLHESKYILFGGHRGCGKSTELRRLKKKLHRSDRYFVIFIDALAVLDTNNLRYSDILLAQANALITALSQASIQLEQVFLTRLEDWFHERIEKHETFRDLSAEIKAGLKVESGIPFLGKIFGSLTNSARIGSTHKTELRKVVRNSFSEFAEAFNALIGHAEKQISAAGKGKKLLFIVDGTDRLRVEDADSFFIHDVHQLQLITANTIYCTPINLLSERGVLLQHFKLVRLPMIKLGEKGSSELLLPALAKLRELVYRRVDRALFDEEATLDQLIRYSGGHIRDLIRLLNYCLEETLGKSQITLSVANAAIQILAIEYRRLIEQEDYLLLAQIDKADADYTPNDEKTRRLLYDLALLEYNAYWWQSHPVIKTLAAYQTALNSLE